MGIKNLKKFIRDKFPNEIQRSNLSNFYGQVFMMDIMSYIYKFKVSMIEKWLQSVINMIKLFKLYNIHVNIVFEGESPVEKNKEREQRRKQRKQQEQKILDIKNDLEKYYETKVVSPLLREVCEKMEKLDTDKINRLLHFNKENEINNKVEINVLTDKMIEYIQQFLYKKENQLVIVSEHDVKKISDICDVFGVPYLYSENEAETLCCKMSRNINYDKKPIGVISEDSDVLAYGSEILLCDLNISNGDCNIIYLPSLLKSMDMSYQHFIEFCVLCGTDYNKNIPGIGSIKCYELVMKHNSIKDIYKNEEKLISKKITDSIEKKKKILKMKELNQLNQPNEENENYILDNEDNLQDNDQDNDIDINTTPEKMLNDMLHSIDMFNLLKFVDKKYTDKYHWNANIDYERVLECCLRYNIDYSSIENLWKNKIKILK
jgi:5'-3' exonuclease